MATTGTEGSATFRRPPQHLFDEPVPAAYQLPALPARADRIHRARRARQEARGEAMLNQPVELSVCNTARGEQTADG